MQLSKICVIFIILTTLFQISQNQTAASFGPSGYFDIRSQTLTLSNGDTSPYTFEFLTNIGPSSLAHRSPFYMIHYADQIIFDTTSKSVYLVSRISSIGATSFRVQFYFKTASGGSFYSLASSSLYKLMYMIIDPSFNLAYLSCLLSLVTTETVVTNAGLTFTNSVSSIAGSSVITLSASDTQYFYSLISFEVINTSANQNGASIKLMFSTTDANNFQIRLNYIAPESIKDLKICLFIYNKTPFVSASLQVKSGSGAGSLQSNVPDYGYGLSWSSYTNALAIYGMSGLQLLTSQRFGFDFAITMTTGASIMVRAKNLIITSSVPVFQFNFMSVAGLYCSSSSTYFNSTNSQCYPCHQTCATCFGGSATQCKSCNAAHHRSLVNSSCLPMSAYYDDGTNAAAQPCDTSVCIECSMHATNCTSCSSTKFYNPYTCTQCTWPCATCSSATACLTCSSGITLVGTTCPCANGQYPDSQSQSCTQCSNTLPHCTTCTATPACTQCETGYFVDNQACTQCSASLPNCVNCNAGPVCTLCTTGYYIDTGSCVACMLGCISCSSANTCSSCNAGITLLNGKCTCNSGNYIDPTGTNCVTCPSTCVTCSSATTCLTCVSTKYLSASHWCQNCHSTCLTCSGPSLTECLTCSAALNRQFDASTSKCNCKNAFFHSTSTNDCQPCPSACVTCSSDTVCLTCVSSKYLSASNWCENCHSSCLTCNGGLNSNCVTCDEVTRTFSSGSCVCKTGAEDANGNCITPVTPVTPVITCNDVKCNLCPSDANICTQCKSTLTLSGSTCTCPSTSYYSAGNTACYACHGTCATCSGPSSTQCLSCLSTQNRQLNSGTSSCDCKPNFTSSTSQLVCVGACSSGYSYNSSALQCEQICGDGILFDLQCDDGNVIAGDGCDSSCKIQTGYSCVNGSQTSPSICSYNGPINFTLIEAKKQEYSNTVNMEYKLSPQLKHSSQYPNFTSYLSASDPAFTINQALYSLDQKRLRLTFSYNQSIMSRTLSIAYSPPSGLVSVQSSSFEWSPSVQNGFALNYYENSIYKTARNLSHLAMGSSIVGLIIFIFGLLFRKMIGIQIILLIQAEILSIVMLKDLDPYFVGLTTNNYVFGYNGLYDSLGIKSTVNFQNDSPIFSTIGFSPIFGQNVNIMVFFVLGLYVLSIFIGIFSKCANKQTAYGMKQASLIIARQIAFGTIVFITLNITASYIIEVNQSKIMKNLAQLSGIFKIMSIVLIVMNYIIYAISYKQSPESTKFYRRQSKISQLQPLFIYSKAIIIAILITLHHKLGPITFYILLIFQLIYLVFIIILRPFRRKLDLARSIIIELAMTYIFVIRWLLRLYVNSENPGKWKGFSEFAIVTEYGLVAVAIFISGLDLVYHFVKASKYDSQVHPEPSQIGGQIGRQNESQVEKGQQKHYEKHDPNSTNPSIKFYLEKQITKKYKTPHRNKLYTQKQNNNASMAQLIQFSNDDLEDQIGYESKRKLKGKQNQDSYDNIDYNQKNISNNRRKRKQKQRGDKYYGDLEIVEMDD